MWLLCPRFNSCLLGVKDGKRNNEGMLALRLFGRARLGIYDRIGMRFRVSEAFINIEQAYMLLNNQTT